MGWARALRWRVLGSVGFKEAFKRKYNEAGLYSRKRIPPVHPVTFFNKGKHQYVAIIAQIVKTFSM
jgi:hypothetical protein